MNPRLSLLLIVGIDLFILLYQSLQLSISYYEVIALQQHTFLSYIVNNSLDFFGKNDLSLRMPMIMMHLLSIYFLYQISKDYIKKEKDRTWLILIYLLLPGVISSALIVNSAGVVLLTLFFFIYLYKRFPIYYSYILLVIMLILDKNFIYLYFALMIYSLFEKEKFFLFYSMCLFIFSYSIYGIEIKGVPSGHFLDTLGIYLAIFSPPIFIYIIYVLLRRFLQNKQDIIWYISSTTLLFAFVVSIRQKIAIEYIAPYLIISLPIMANTFIESYNIRLTMFRKKYKYIFLLTLSFLVFNSIVLIFNKELYAIIENPKKHFSYKMHIAKELSINLKDKGINCLDTKYKLLKRLEFYGIGQCDKFILKELPIDSRKKADVTVSYNNIEVFKATVTKINNK